MEPKKPRDRSWVGILLILIAIITYGLHALTELSESFVRVVKNNWPVLAVAATMLAAVVIGLFVVPRPRRRPMEED